MKGAVSQAGQVTILDLPETSKSTWHTIFGSFYSLNLLNLIHLSLQISKGDGIFQTYLLSKGIGKGILLLWPGVLFGPIPVSKSLGKQIGQCDLFLISNCQVSK